MPEDRYRGKIDTSVDRKQYSMGDGLQFVHILNQLFKMKQVLFSYRNNSNKGDTDIFLWLVYVLVHQHTSWQTSRGGPPFMVGN
jgi:hypothetical protein